MSERLARFRADPAKVRVSIRHEGDMYRATVASREETVRGRLSSISAVRYGAGTAIAAALDLAKTASIEGIDLDLQWAYRHPWPEKSAS